ncbi:MAG: hypothetical protein Q7T25_10665 [Sideroxyarcus sp.]|nr:hypothetical protein [Sideroxyarcus sp.]
MDELTRITLDLPGDEAEALAQYLKRLGFGDLRALARNDNEAYTMQAAAERLRTALAEVGYAPR